MTAVPVIVFVDVDDTLVRSVGAKRIPIPRVVAGIRDLKAAGATLYLWSSGGAEYARSTAFELGLSECFTAFLPKPTVLIDDQAVPEWRGLRHVHPNEGIEAILKSIRSPRAAPPAPAAPSPGSS